MALSSSMMKKQRKNNWKIDFSTPRLFADIKGNIDYLNLSYFGVQGNGKSVLVEILMGIIRI